LRRWYRRGCLEQIRPNALLNVDFKHTKGGLVSLDRQLKGVQKPFGSVEIRDNPLIYRYRVGRYSERLRIESEVNYQFLRGPCDPTEIRIAGNRLLIIYLDSGHGHLPGLSLGPTCGGLSCFLAALL